ncbi:MAG: hypothetical protein ACYDAI_07570 [Trichloromonadaceae bacterium]
MAQLAAFPTQEVGLRFGLDPFAAIKRRVRGFMGVIEGGGKVTAV